MNCNYISTFIISFHYFRNSDSCNSIDLKKKILSKESMLEMLSLLKKMPTFIITGINTLYFKSNYNMKKVFKSSHENHWKI